MGSKRLWLMVLSASALAVPAAVSAASPVAQGPVQDVVTGRALPDFDPDSSVATLVDIDARSGPSGENPTGRVTIIVGCDLPSFSPCGTASSSQGGRVTCLNVQGNRAIIGYYGAANASFDYPVRFRGLVEVVDNGPPSARDDTLDVFYRGVEIWVNPAPTPNPLDVPITSCPDTLPVESGPFDFHLFSGLLPPPPSRDLYGPAADSFIQDYSVVDAQPRPRSKDDCKNGGWRNFPGLKNHGDCVSFVRHQARQECIFIRAAHGPAAFRAWYGSGVHKPHAMRRCVRERSGD